MLAPDLATTGDLRLFLNGAPFTGDGVLFSLGNFEPQILTLSAFKGDNGISYEGVVINLFSACERALSLDSTSGVLDPIVTSISISASFLPSCFPVQWHPSFVPFPPMTLGNNKLTLVALFPTYSPGLDNDVNQVSFFYRRVGDVTWEDIVDIAGRVDPVTSSVLYDWTVSGNLAAGEYEMQIQAKCNFSASPSLSPSMPLVNDQTLFEAFGVISPVGPILLKGQEISVLFNKDLDCPKLWFHEVLSDNNPALGLDYQVVCDGKEVDLLLGPSSHDALQGTNFHANFTVYSLTGYNLDFSFDLDTDYNECVSSPCLNRGLCVDNPAYFYCDCVDGYSGFLCDTLPVTPISLMFVTSTLPLADTFAPVYINLNGTLGVSGPLLLRAGFDTGSSSKITVIPPAEIGELLSFTLSINSTDGWLPASITIRTPLYPILTIPINQWVVAPQRPMVTVQVDFCQANPCSPGYNCTSTPFSCDCPVNHIWTGQFCEEVGACVSNPCLNGASCLNQGTSSYTCTCVPGYGGTNCQTLIDNCASNPCTQGQFLSCINMVNAVNCTCKPGYSGYLCETEINECASNPCLNGGTCVSGIDQFICNCPHGTNGTFCQGTAPLYSCLIFTPNVATGDTTASVYFTFTGTLGHTASLLMGTGFALGSTDTGSGYDWTNVGALTSITVLLSPATDAWYFGNGVCQVNGGAQMTFTYNAWLNKVTPSVTILGTVA